MSATPLLRVDRLSRSFGRFAALAEVSLSVRSGQLTALIGPNGAGKTTFYNVISGRLHPSSGRVYLDGRDITGFPPHRLARLGLARSFQITNVFTSLTVLENVLVPLVLARGQGRDFLGSLARRGDLRAEAERTLGEVGLAALAERPAHTLAYGDKRLLEIAIALARRPRLVLLDEPTAGMNPEETDRTMRLVRDLAGRLGTTIFLTEHDMRVVFGIAERVLVLHQGMLLADGAPEEIRGNRLVREAYLGGTVGP